MMDYDDMPTSDAGWAEHWWRQSRDRGLHPETRAYCRKIASRCIECSTSWIASSTSNRRAPRDFPERIIVVY